MLVIVKFKDVCSETVMNTITFESHKYQVVYSWSPTVKKENTLQYV